MAQCEGAVAAPYDFSIPYYKCLANYFCWWVQTHNKLSWEYCLVNLSKTATGHITLSKLVFWQKYTHAQKKKKTLKSGQGYTEHRNTAKRNREIRHNNTKNPRANHKNFGMFRNTTISEFKATIT